MAIEQNQSSGNAELALLSVLKSGDLYGYEIITKLGNQSCDTFHMKEGSIYPLLHTMEQEHRVKSYTKTSPSGKARRYYHLTKNGQVYLSKKEQAYKQSADTTGGQK